MKHKKRTPKQKELLSLFNNLLDVILTDKTLMSSKDEKKKENENDKILMSSENDNENETMNQKKNIIIKQLNDTLDEIINKFEEQIKSIKK